MKTALELAQAEIGTLEWADGSNPRVVAYYKDAGHPEVVDDAVAWCAAFVGAMLYRAGIKPSGKLTARSYMTWGNAVPIDAAHIKLGDIGVKPRGSAWQGHVFFIEKVSGANVICIGGNQRDSVSRATVPIASLIGVRRAPNDTPMVNPTPGVHGAGKPKTKLKPPITPVPTKPNWLAIIIAAIAALFRRRK